ncbi:MAG: hypothetical protein M1296_00165 [Chloroflexi bacterium]|nr:hypothetical protein [Chloroflexota bacterium]
MLYHIITGASSARRVPQLTQALAPLIQQLMVLQTANAKEVLSPRELSLSGSVRLITSYFR